MCVASICFKRACLIICCTATPQHTSTKWQVFCQNVYNMDWCVVVYLLKKDRNNFQWNYSLPCHAPTKWQVPFETLQNGLLFLFSCFTCLKRSGLQTAQNIFASIYTFSVPPSCPYKVRGPRRNSQNMVWCFVISCAYSHIAEDTPREVLKRKFEFKVILSICVVFLFPRPPHAISCPYKMTGFLPSTYKMGWRCGSFFLKHAT